MGGFGAAVSGLHDDIIFAARVDDHTQPFFDEFDKRIDNLAKRFDDTSRKTKKGAKESANAIGLIAGAVAGVTQQLVVMGMKGLASMKRLVKSSILLAARAETLKISMTRIGATAGYSAEEMANLEEKMKATGITTVKSRQALLKMIQANLDLSKATDLARIAQNAAVIAGTDSSTAFGRMVHGITTLNPLILRQLGIIINMQEEIKKYAAANNIAATAIDGATKQQLFMNAVMTAGERIAGSYEAAMETAGKQAGSMTRHIEELQLAIGRAFQPAYSQLIQFQTKQLKEMKKWFDDNEEAVRDWGIVLGETIHLLVEGFDTLLIALDAIAEVTGTVFETVSKELALVLGQLGGMDTSSKDIDSAWENLGTTFHQVLAMVISSLEGALFYIGEFVNKAGAVASAMVKLTSAMTGKGNVADALKEWSVATADMAVRMQTLDEETRKLSQDRLIELSEKFGLIEKSSKGAGDGMDALNERMEAMNEEIEDVISKIKELNNELKEEMAEIEKQRARDAIRDAIDEARQREDLARDHNDRLKKIHKDAAKSRTKLTKDLAKEERQLIEDQAKERQEVEEESAENMIDIEVDYRRRLMDIQRAFEDNIAEAARNNDAVAVARLLRQNDRNLKEARIGRDRQIVDEQRDREDSKKQLELDQAEERQILKEDAKERREALAEDLAEQLKMVEEQRTEDIENLERSLQRKKEDQMLQRKWEEEDRAEKWEVELKGLADHFAELQHIDELGLQYLLNKHGEFIKDDLTLWDRYYNRRTTAAAQRRYGSAISGDTSAYEGAEVAGVTNAEESFGPEGYEYGFARGGFGVFNTPRKVNVAEEVPELVAAIPLSAIVNHNINMAGRIDVNGNGVIPSGSEGDIGAAVFNLLAQFGQQLLGRSG